jgi:hypothetical protein
MCSALNPIWNEKDKGGRRKDEGRRQKDEKE